MANEKPVRFPTDAYLESGSFTFNGACAVGHWTGDPTKGALRFTNIDIDRFENIQAAELRYVYSSVGGAGQWRFKCRAIKEVNTGSFGYPFGRPQTNEVQVINEGQPTSGGTKSIDVRGMMQEVVNNGSWNRFNPMGFILENDGSSNNVYAFADLGRTYLWYRIAGSPNLRPTPKTVAPPTFPGLDDMGFKVSFPGYNVIGQTDETKLLYTSRKEVLKIKAEAQVPTNAGVEKLIAHGLPYKPDCAVFLRKNGLSFELPRIFWGASDPVGGGVQGYWAVDNTYLRIVTYQNAEVYYYILLDEQAI